MHVMCIEINQIGRQTGIQIQKQIDVPHEIK